MLTNGRPVDWNTTPSVPSGKPATERFAYGLVVPMPTRLFNASIERVSPSIFQALTAEEREVDADVLKFKKLLPMNIDPDPACNVPATCKFDAIVDVPVVVPTCRSPWERMTEPVAETERKEFPSALCTSKMLAVDPPPPRKMAAVAEVEVASTERTAGEKGVDCPIDTWSAAAKSRTVAPSSIQPDTAPPAAAEAAQELSIKRKQPLVKRIPLLNEEVPAPLVEIAPPSCRSPEVWMLPSVVVAMPTPSPPDIYVSPPMFSLARSPKVEVPMPMAPDPAGVDDKVLKESRANVPVAVVEVAKVKEVEALFNMVEVDWV